MHATAASLVAEARSEITEIDADLLFARPSGASLLIDVREPHEFAAGHLAGAVNIPSGVLEFEVEAHPAVACATDPALASREREIVLYCRSGGRSALAAQSLQRLGFLQVRSLAGGIGAWRERGYPVTTR